MELSKKDIQIIDKYLKNKHVIHWDIRLEMIDHLASEVEDKDIKLNINYVQKELPYWKITKIVNQRKRFVNLKYGKLFRSDLKRFFKSSTNLIVVLIFILLQVWIAKYGYKKLVIFDIIIAYTPILIPFFYAFRNWFRGNRSYNLEMIFTRWVMTGFGLYLLMLLYKTELSVTLINSLFILFTTFLVIKHILSYNMYKKALKNCTSIFTDYKTLWN